LDVGVRRQFEVFQQTTPIEGLSVDEAFLDVCGPVRVDIDRRRTRRQPYGIVSTTVRRRTSAVAL
jgi:hypothetical protein